MQQYVWELSEWPQFVWREKELLSLISATRLKQGQLIERVNHLWEDNLKRAEAIILEEETIKTAQIEGERYNPASVRSSVNRRLGLDYGGLPKTERHVDGLVEVLLDATLAWQKPLTKKRLFAWHGALFPTGYSGISKIQVGKFRSNIVQVVSGPVGREKVHFLAPDAKNIAQEMKMFFQWWKKTENHLDGIIRAGIAHFYFVTIHPFDDGNGRIARVLTDMALAQDDKLSRRYYSFSNEIVKRRAEYYQILQTTQKGGLDLTEWLSWFTQCFSSALDNSEILLSNIFAKAEFWQKHHQVEINDRQQKVINKLLDSGKDQFTDNLTTRKYMGMTKISRRSAIREIQDLVKKKILKQNLQQGRNVNYDINW